MPIAIRMIATTTIISASVCPRLARLTISTLLLETILSDAVEGQKVLAAARGDALSCRYGTRGGGPGRHELR